MANQYRVTYTILPFEVKRLKSIAKKGWDKKGIEQLVPMMKRLVKREEFIENIIKGKNADR